MSAVRILSSLLILASTCLPVLANAACHLSRGAAQYLPVVNATAQRHGVDPHLILAVIKIESDFNRNAVSSAGAEGLMQIMPATQSDLGVMDSFNPYDNVDGGVRYLREMILRFGSVRLALLAYNAGPARVDNRHVPVESIRYSNAVLNMFWCYRRVLQ